MKQRTPVPLIGKSPLAGRPWRANDFGTAALAILFLGFMGFLIGLGNDDPLAGEAAFNIAAVIALPLAVIWIIAKAIEVGRRT
jgi:hypothetical protein